MQWAPGDGWLHQGGGGSTCRAACWSEGVPSPLACPRSGGGWQTPSRQLPWSARGRDQHPPDALQRRRRGPAPALCVEQRGARAVPWQLCPRLRPGAVGGGEGGGVGRAARGASAGSLRLGHLLRRRQGASCGHRPFRSALVAWRASLEHDFEMKGLIFLSLLLFLNYICGWENRRAATQRLPLRAGPVLGRRESLPRGWGSGHTVRATAALSCVRLLSPAQRRCSNAARPEGLQGRNRGCCPATSSSCSRVAASPAARYAERRPLPSPGERPGSNPGGWEGTRGLGSGRCRRAR